jgi:acetyl-CoA synthetase
MFGHIGGRAAVLAAQRQEKGDRVTIYLPMIPEAAYAMLACARIGAVHSVVFGGFSPDSAGRPHRPRDCEPSEMNAEDPLFILYTSGSTGKPKGVLHTTGGYLVYAAMTHECVFDYRDGDVYWCTADVGWVTGHSYIVYGPLANGATTLMFEGVPNYPDAGRFWQVVDKHKVNIFYTAPTAIRALMREGEEPVKKASRASAAPAGLGRRADQSRSLAVVPPRVGEGRCPIVDTWWQTETGGILITPAARRDALKPGSATLPFFGVSRRWSTPKGKISKAPTEGNLCMPIPGRARCARSTATTSASSRPTSRPIPGPTSPATAPPRRGRLLLDHRPRRRRDQRLRPPHGHGRGRERAGRAPKVAEAAVVGYPHDIKGQGIYAYVTLKAGESRPRSCARNWWPGCARRSARSPRRT